MSENKRNIDDLFLQELGNATETPPSSVWQNVEQRLDKSSGKKRKHWRFYLLIIFLLLGSVIAAYIVKNKLNSSKEKEKPSALYNSTLPVQAHSGNDTETALIFIPENTEKQKTLVTSPAKPHLEDQELYNEGASYTSDTISRKSKSAVGAKYNSINAKMSMGNNKIQGLSSPTVTPQQNKNNKENPSRASADNGLSVDKKVKNLAFKQSNHTIKQSNHTKRSGNKTQGQNSAAHQSQPGTIPAKNNKGDLSHTSAGRDMSISKKGKTKKEADQSDIIERPGNKQTNQPASAKARTSPSDNHNDPSETFAKNVKNSSKSPLPTALTNPLSGVPADEREDYLKEETVTLPDNTMAATKTGSQNKRPRQSKKNEQKVSNSPTDKSVVDIKEITYNSEDADKETEDNGTTEKEETDNEDEENSNDVSDDLTAGTTSSGGGSNAASPVKDKIKRSLNMTIGIKAGYETGTKSYTANKLTAAIFGEVDFSKKLSFIVQPGFRFANINQEYGTETGTYIRPGAVTGTLYHMGMDSFGKPSGSNDYAYRQNYDSIVSSLLAKRKFIEIEIPFLFRYKVDKNFSFMAGMNFTFGKVVGMESILKTFSGLSLTDTIFRHFDTSGKIPAPPGKFSHTGSVPFSSYVDPAVADPVSQIRFGYMIGLSYTVKQRLMFDLIIQQNLSRLNDIDDGEIKKLFTQPYVRFTIGYSIFGKK